MAQQEEDTGNTRAKSRSYTPDEEHQLIAFVIDECGGQFGLQEAREIATRLNKKPASIVAKARSLNLNYRTEAHQIRNMTQTGETASIATASFDWLNPDHWPESLSMLAEQWQFRGQEGLWAVRKGDLLAKLHADADAIRADSLFEAHEIEAKRDARRAELESAFLMSMTDKVKFWPSIFRSKTLDLETLEKRFEKKGRLAEFRAAHDEYQERCAQIEDLPVDELLDRAVVTQRRFEQMAPMRRAAFETEMATIKAYDKFKETLNQLPREDIDKRLDKLKSEFLYVRRARVWYAEFENFMNEVGTNGTSLPAGGNESPVRLLQHDFLLGMEHRLNLYWRLHQVREKAFAQSLTDEIGRLGYLESRLTEMYRRNEPAAVCDQIIVEFLKTVERPDVLRTVRQTEAERAAFLQIDHNARRAVWEEFKLRSIKGTANITRRFNELKNIVRFTPEWIREYKIFQTDLLAQRSMDASRKNSKQEIGDVESFIHRLVLRIELELEVDIAYRSLEQKLTLAGDDDNLRTNNRLIAQQIKARAADEILKIKIEFLNANDVALPGHPEKRVVSMQKWRS